MKHNFARFTFLSALVAAVLSVVVGIVSAAPGVFTLVAPENGAVLTEVPATVEVQWTEASGAETYTFDLDRPVADNVTLSDLTPGADTDGLLCTDATCTLTVTDPASILTDEGTYSWTVTATDATGITPAENNPFIFTVDLTSDAPPIFNVLSPVDGTLVYDPSLVTAVTWQPAVGATGYTFLLTQISSNVRAVGDTVAVPATPEELGCTLPTATTCTLTVDGAAVLTEDGQYSWTVLATAGDQEVEAANGPYFFTVNTGTLEFVENGGFEAQDETGAKTLAPWTGTGVGNGAVKCNTDTKTVTTFGICALKVKSGANQVRKAQQTFDASFLPIGTILNVSAQIDATRRVPKAIKVVVRIAEDLDGNGNPDKIVIKVDAEASTGFAPVTGSGEITGTVTSAKIVISNKRPGRIFVDEVSVTADPVPDTVDPEPTPEVTPAVVPLGAFSQ